MAHHGPNPIFDEVTRKLFDKERERVKDTLGLGATNKHPQGKLNKDDEGEIRYAVAHYKNSVVIEFGKPVRWMGMDVAQARELAKLLIKHADEADKSVGPPDPPRGKHNIEGG